LVSRGHRYQDLVDGYPVGLILNFSRAARLNRREKVLDQAAAVSLGIRDALNPDGKLLRVWLAAGEDAAARPALAEPAATPQAGQLLRGLPLKK
jgi:hypothetical protein